MTQTVKQREEMSLWWKKTGCRELNKVLINWIGYGTGYVPLVNLISEFCESITETQMEELIPLMVQDGATLKLQERSNGVKTVQIWVK